MAHTAGAEPYTYVGLCLQMGGSCVAAAGVLGGWRRFLTLGALSACVPCSGGTGLVAARQMAVAVGLVVLRGAHSGGGLGAGVFRGALCNSAACVLRNHSRRACHSRYSQKSGNLKSWLNRRHFFFSLCMAFLYPALTRPQTPPHLHSLSHARTIM